MQTELTLHSHVLPSLNLHRPVPDDSCVKLPPFLAHSDFKCSGVSFAPMFLGSLGSAALATETRLTSPSAAMRVLRIACLLSGRWALPPLGVRLTTPQ